MTRGVAHTAYFLSKIKDFEKTLFEMAEIKIPDVLKKIEEKGEIDEDDKTKIEKLILEVKESFKN